MGISELASVQHDCATVAWVEQQDVQGHPPFMPKFEQHHSNAAEPQSITELCAVHCIA